MNDQKPKNQWLMYSSLGMQIVAILLISIFGGRYLDKILKTKPLFTISLALLSIFGIFYKIIKDTNSKS